MQVEGRCRSCLLSARACRRIREDYSRCVSYWHRVAPETALQDPAEVTAKVGGTQPAFRIPSRNTAAHGTRDQWSL